MRATNTTLSHRKYKVAWWLRLIAALGVTWPFMGIAILIFNAAFKEPTPHTFASCCLMGSSAAAFASGVLIALFLLTEQIEIEPELLIRRSIFGRKAIPLREITSVVCQRFGRGNSVLKVMTNTRTIRMAWAYASDTIEDIALDVQHFKNAHFQEQVQGAGGNRQ